MINIMSFKIGILSIKKDDLIADKYGNAPLSLAIEKGNIEKIRQIYDTQTYTNLELLKKIAIDIMNPTIQKQYDLSKDIYLKIYSEAKYQLDLLGEDITEVIDAFIT